MMYKRCKEENKNEKKSYASARYTQNTSADAMASIHDLQHIHVYIYIDIYM